MRGIEIYDPVEEVREEEGKKERVGLHIRKIADPGIAYCTVCDRMINYTNRGKDALTAEWAIHAMNEPFAISLTWMDVPMTTLYSSFNWYYDNWIMTKWSFPWTAEPFKHMEWTCIHENLKLMLWMCTCNWLTDLVSLTEWMPLNTMKF